VTNNVACDINPGGTYSYGFQLMFFYLGDIQVPIKQGADISQPGESVTLNGNAIPIVEFANNEAYGSMPNGMTVWWAGSFGGTPEGNAGTIKNFASGIITNGAILATRQIIW